MPDVRPFMFGSNCNSRMQRAPFRPTRQDQVEVNNERACNTWAGARLQQAGTNNGGSGHDNDQRGGRSERTTNRRRNEGKALRCILQGAARRSTLHLGYRNAEHLLSPPHAVSQRGRGVAPSRDSAIPLRPEGALPDTPLPCCENLRLSESRMQH